MPRNLKPQLVEQNYRPRHNIPYGIDIYLNRNDLSFFFDFQGERYEGGDIHTVHTKARDVLEASVDVKFIPIIEVDVMSFSSFQHKPILGLTFHRMYIAKRTDGKWLSVSWELAKRNADEMFNYSSHDHSISKRLAPAGHIDRPMVTKTNDSTDYIIPYDENLWLGLVELQKALGILRDKINGLLSSEEGLAIIGSASIANLLGTGEPKSEQEAGE